MGVLSIPVVQTWLVGELSARMSEKVGHQITFDYVNIRWFDTILLRGLRIEDTQGLQMISTKTIILDFKLRELITSTSINFDKAILVEPDVDMYYNAPNGDFNFTYFINQVREVFATGDTTGRAAKAFVIDKIILNDGQFQLFRTDKEPIADRFDHYHFTLKDMGGDMENFVLKPGHISFDTENFHCVDSTTNLPIERLKTRFVYSRTSMVFQNMEAIIGQSTIEQSMVFSYDSPRALRAFEDSVTITANIKKSLLYSQDLAWFVPALRSYAQYYRVQGFLEGPINRFEANNVSIEFGQGSRLQGYISLYGLPELNETFINAKISQSVFRIGDLDTYMSAESQERLKKFGEVRFNGRFSGFLHDFVSNGEFYTDIGYFQTDINLKFPQKEAGLPNYSGKLVTRNLDLGSFLSDTAMYQQLDMNGRISGVGFTKETAKFDLNSQITRIGIKNYEYKNIKTNAAFANEFFEGTLLIDDPNLQFEGYASIDLTDNKDQVNIQARLDTAFLQNLNLTEEYAFVRSELNVDMTGLELDDLLGELHLKNAMIAYKDRTLEFDSLTVLSERDSLSRSLWVKSKKLRAHLVGDFNYSAFFKDVAETVKEYKLIFDNDSEKIKRYYAGKHTDYSDYYYLDFDVVLTDLNPLIHLFAPEVSLSENTSVVGSFTGGPMSVIEFSSDFKRLTYDAFEFVDNRVVINSTKSADTSYVYGSYALQSDRQLYKGKASTENLVADLSWNENHIEFLCNIDQARQSNYARLSGDIFFLPDETHLTLDPSELQAIDKVWHFSDRNRLILKDKYYQFIDFSIFHEEQRIAANGVVSANPSDSLFIGIHQFDMRNINPLLDKSLSGEVNGFVQIANYFSSTEIDSKIDLQDFTINEFLVGDIMASSAYQNEARRFQVELEVLRDAVPSMDIDGYLMPAAENQIELNANFNQSNLSFLEPFIEDYVTDLRGNLNGNMQILGRFDHPVVRGEAEIEEGGLIFDYLNTRYTFQSKLIFDNDKIEVQDLVLRDENSNTGEVVGRFTHQGFKELGFDFYGNLQNVQVLNTTAKHNESYYGTAYATGDFRLYGKQRNINLTATAQSQKGTRIFIPLEGAEEAAREEFIHFVHQRDTLDGDAIEAVIAEANKKTALEGLNMNLDLDITPEAYCEIIFDLTAGDIIRGRGNGKINLKVDTRGDFYMFGEYEILDGAYNFTLYNIINKEFQIMPNSSITWTGDPYAAILDIRATYRQLASLEPIMPLGSQSEDSESPELRRKYPAYVILDIDGNLKAPQIEFDINVEDYPKGATANGIRLETAIEAFRKRIETDEQELKRQVFSLIVLRNFSSENAFNVGGSVGRSVSEFISNQISYWITQFDENLEIDLDLGALDQEAFNTFQLRLSYSFLQGRLRITRDGGFTDQYSQANVASILGDWSVEYLLTPDGKLRARIYNRTNFNAITPTENISTTAGFSMMHTTSFDNLREIFGKARNEAIKRREQEAQPKIKEEDKEVTAEESTARKQ
jgi:hypothetical protein